jgi:hypothetical protein
MACGGFHSLLVYMVVAHAVPLPSCGARRVLVPTTTSNPSHSHQIILGAPATPRSTRYYLGCVNTRCESLWSTSVRTPANQPTLFLSPRCFSLFSNSPNSSTGDCGLHGHRHYCFIEVSCWPSLLARWLASNSMIIFFSIGL